MVTKELVRLAKVAGITAGVTLFIANDISIIAKVEGNSMQPTFNPNCGQKNEDLRLLAERGLSREALTRELKTRLKQDRVLLNKWIVKDKTKLKIGDVVILVSPRDPNKSLIKRISAMPGDAIYLIQTGETKVIEDGHCWVEGDNQQSSFDSNIFGQVPLALIGAKVYFIVWPIDRMRQIKCDPNISLNSTKTVLLSHKRDQVI